jgi:predicted ribosomally synthesized peptide with nif11-like leader
MSNNRIDEFFGLVKNDEALRRELEATPTEEAFCLAAVRRAAERGIVFTAGEVKDASRHQVGSELSEAALATVAGGESHYETVTSWRFCTWEWLGC